MSEITRLGAMELGRLVSRGDLSPVETVDTFLQRVSQANPSINAITDLQAERAREQALRAAKRQRRGDELGPLFGVPLTIKSSIAAEGCRYECGTKLRAGHVAETDATLVARLKRAGAIILGTTNVPEFLMAYETDNALYGRTISPFHEEFTPGGSSGGCAAAVAAGCSAGSFGSDAGGSVRVPAHFCGLYGLKPTPGVIPRTGHWPAVAGPSTTLAGVGPIARTAEDLEAFLAITAGHDSYDTSSYPHDRCEAPDLRSIRDLKIGWFDHAWDTPVTPETRAAVRVAATALRERGFRVERMELKGLAHAPHVWWLQFGICLRTLIEGSTPDGYRMHPLSYEAMAAEEEESETSYRDLLMGWVLQDQMRYKLLQQMREHRLLLSPVAAIPAFRHGERSWSVEGQTVSYPGAFVYSQVFNLLGVPAATAPVGQAPEGFPIGVQVVGRPHEDEIVTAVVKELEAGLGGDRTKGAASGPA